MAKYLKNTSGVTDTWNGQEIANGAYYELQQIEEIAFANDSKVITDLGSGNLKAARDNSGTTDIADVSEALLFLRREDQVLRAADGTADGIRVDSVNGGSKYRLCVDSSLDSTDSSPGTIPSTTSKLRYDDMNATTGGVARDTEITVAASWTQVYTYSGSGLFFGYLLQLESLGSSGWDMRLVVDGEEIFGASGINLEDIDNGAGYQLNAASKHEHKLGLYIDGYAFVWQPPFPMIYNSSIAIHLKRTGTGKKFKAGLATLSKES